MGGAGFGGHLDARTVGDAGFGGGQADEPAPVASPTLPVRVLHLSASFPRSLDDAVAPFLLDLALAQVAAGSDVHVVASHDAGLPAVDDLGGVTVHRARYGPDRWEVLAYRGGGHAKLRRPAHATLLPGLVLSLLIRTATVARRHRPDVVHAHFLLPGGLVAALVPGRRRHRTVITLHGNDVELAASRLAGPVARFVARRADAVLAVSEPLARRAESVLGLAPGAVTVARLPLADGLVATPLPGGELRCIAAGRASTEKGFDVLLDALARPEAAPWRATLVVEGPERERLVAQVSAAALGERVTFLPLQSRARLFDLLRDHHLVVVPSRTEGLGLLAVEALALGRPVVASAVGGLTEAVVDGDDGVLVTPDDPAALAAALAKLAGGDLHPPVGSGVARHCAAAVADAHAGPYGLVSTAEPAP